MRLSDVGQRIHSYKQGSYKWDLVRFNHTSHEIIMTNIRDDLLENWYFQKTCHFWLLSHIVFFLNYSLDNLWLIQPSLKFDCRPLLCQIFSLLKSTQVFIWFEIQKSQVCVDKERGSLDFLSRHYQSIFLTTAHTTAALGDLVSLCFCWCQQIGTLTKNYTQPIKPYKW